MFNKLGNIIAPQAGGLTNLVDFRIDKANYPVRVLQIKSRLRLYPRMVFSQLAVAFLLVGIMWDGVPHNVLLAWLILVCTVHSVEMVYWLLFHTRTKAIAQCRRWNFLFSVFSGIAGLVWGSCSLLMFVPDQMLYQMFLICVILGMSAGAVTSNPTHPPSLFIYLLALVLPLVIRVLWELDWPHLLLGSMLIVYLMSVVSG